MDFAYPYAALGTVLVILVYIWTGMMVTRARKVHGVIHPDTAGAPAFNRIWRAHMNTLEALPQFLPAMWLFALVISDCWAGLLALLWAVGRVLYVRGYAVEAGKRSFGFGVSLLATAVGLFGAAGVIVAQLLS